jgi:hypothetical protein
LDEVSVAGVEPIGRRAFDYEHANDAVGPEDGGADGGRYRGAGMRLAGIESSVVFGVVGRGAVMK